MKKSILIIDDDPDFRNYVRAIVEPRGMDAVLAASLAEAETYLQESKPNLILLDMELQGEHGNEFLEKRAINPGLSRIPVIVCSAQNLAIVVKEAIRYGADDYLLKPMKQAWLMQRIRKHLLNEVALSFTFPDGEEGEVEMAVDAEAVFLSGNSFLARSPMGFAKGVLAQVDVTNQNGEALTAHFISYEKSRFAVTGPFDTLFSEDGLSHEEKQRLKMLKTHWSQK